MLLAASESAVTKKPRLRLMTRRSSSVRPFGSFHVAMSRDMLTSCGIQWFAQVARYFSQAHLYLKGTSWLTSVWPLMMRLSAATTRWCDGDGTAVVRGSDGAAIGTSADSEGSATSEAVFGRLRTSSSQTSMCVCPMARDYVSVACE